MPRAGAVWVDVLPNMSGFGRQLQREIGEPVAQASRAAGEAGGEEMVGGLREKVKAGGAAVGLALGAAVAASAVSQLEKEKTGDRLAAQLGLSGKQAERAGKAAGSLYSKAVVDTFEDGAAAVRAVMSSGLVDEKATTRAITSITTKVSDLAATFDQDLTMTANAAAQMIRTGLAKDGAQALDLLTRGLQGPADKAGDLLETVNEYSTQWRKMGLDGASAIGLLNQAVRAGARDSDVAADAIKEFSIRAVDGSDTTKAGFKALGLSATDMATKFGTGGKVATAALDLTLDRLRAIEDPIKREAAAVALFGTQAEDLGEALFAMDPSAAASGLGKVGGAARQVGDTIRDNTSTRIEVLKRQLTSVFGTVVSAVVLPAIEGTIDGVRWLGDVFATTGAWFSKWGAWLIPLGIIIGGLTIALNANAIATGIAMGVMGAYSLAVRGVVLITQGWAVAQGLLNSVMALNPFVLAAIAVIALGAALVVAYKKSEQFRAIVTAAWTAIAAGAMWLWNTVLSPTFSAISMGARILATALTVAVALPVIAAFKLLAAVGMWLWNAGLGPAFRGIGAAGIWLWQTALQPALHGIGAAALWLYAHAIRPLETGGEAALRLLGATGTWLWKNALSPAFRGIGAAALWLYEKGLKPPIDAGKRAARALGA
ncbi:MAG TPA: phage tail tape measure protein, partial [Streptomyces sp.]|nr:phage tail tape measure protein [Streptomyces sp.]